MGKVLPLETAARACVAKLASQKEEEIQELLLDKKIFVIVDEAEVTKQKYISVFVGSLDAPNQTFLVNCHPLDSGRNQGRILQGFKVFGAHPAISQAHTLITFN